jgi:large subunit ribosomal protein L30
MQGKIKITQVQSSARTLLVQRNTLTALGLRGVRKSVVKSDCPQIRGMIRVVDHLVKVEKAS